MIKLETGISTDRDFIEAMKERGQDISAQFPAETFASQLNEVNEEVEVSFLSPNETILQAVNEGEEPVEQVSVSVEVTGVGETTVVTGTCGEEAITSFPATIVRNKGVTETLTVEAEGYVSKSEDITFDEDKEITIELEEA